MFQDCIASAPFVHGMGCGNPSLLKRDCDYENFSPLLRNSVSICRYLFVSVILSDGYLIHYKVLVHVSIKIETQCSRQRT